MDILKKKMEINIKLLFLQIKTKKYLTKYTELWDGVKNSIEKINNKSGEYGKDFMKIKFN